MKPNPYYDESVVDDCREYMVLSVKLWMKYMEKHPEMVPTSKVGPVNEVLYLLDNSDELSTKDLANLYETFVNTFSQYPNILEKLYKIPLLFLVPQTR